MESKWLICLLLISGFSTYCYASKSMRMRLSTEQNMEDLLTRRNLLSNGLGSTPPMG